MDMRKAQSGFRIALAAALLCSVAAGQAAPQAAPQVSTAKVMDDKQAQQIYERSLQLMGSAGFTIPELARAGAPLMENVKQTLESLAFLGYANPQLHYRIISNLKTYLLVADAVPKPVPYPEAARQQLNELRDNVLIIDVYFQSKIEQLQKDLRTPDRDNLHRYSEANAHLSQPAATKPRTVFMGDSITDFWRLDEYFQDKDYVNRGISGQITGQMLGRFLNDVVRLKPQTVVILGGTNDIARGVPPETIEANLTMMADLAEKYNIRPIFATLLPVSDYHKASNPSYERTRQRPPVVIRNVNDWLKSFCAQRNYTLLDYFSAVVTQDGYLKKELSDDGLHPNPSGYRIMAPLAQQAIERTANPSQPEKRRKRLF